MWMPRGSGAHLSALPPSLSSLYLPLSLSYLISPWLHAARARESFRPRCRSLRHDLCLVRHTAGPCTAAASAPASELGRWVGAGFVWVPRRPSTSRRRLPPASPRASACPRTPAEPRRRCPRRLAPRRRSLAPAYALQLPAGQDPSAMLQTKPRHHSASAVVRRLPAKFATTTPLSVDSFGGELRHDSALLPRQSSWLVDRREEPVAARPAARCAPPVRAPHSSSRSQMCFPVRALPPPPAALLP
jgi:hypothetical protein